MQNSNLSLKIFPNSKECWDSFIKKVNVDLQEMMTQFNNDKRRIKDLERIISKLKEISNLSKDNIMEILNYKELFMYIDNSLESSFGALNFFFEQDNFDNPAVKTIYERIVNSPMIIKINSEYNSLAIKVQFDKERIKKLSELIRGSKIDFVLIEELINKYKFDDKTKTNIMLYPVIMLSIRQNEVKNNKEVINNKRIEKEKFYQERFSELCKKYLSKKEDFKDLLVKGFSIKEKMNPREIDMYTSFANNPNEINDYDFTDDIKLKIYVLSFFKIKRDIENFIDGIEDLSMDENDLDDEIAFFSEMLNEFETIAIKLSSYIRDEKIETNEMGNNVYFALDAFNRLLVKKELLSLRNRSSIKALLEKIENVNNSKIDGVKTNHMLGVSNEEEILGKNISMLTTSKMMLAYIMVGKSVLIIAGDTTNSDKFDKVVRLAINKNIVPIKKQIMLIEDSNLDYIELQNKIINEIIGEEIKEKTI